MLSKTCTLGNLQLFPTRRWHRHREMRGSRAKSLDWVEQPLLVDADYFLIMHHYLSPSSTAFKQMGHCCSSSGAQDTFSRGKEAINALESERHEVFGWKIISILWCGRRGAVFKHPSKSFMVPIARINQEPGQKYVQEDVTGKKENTSVWKHTNILIRSFTMTSSSFASFHHTLYA